MLYNSNAYYSYESILSKKGYDIMSKDKMLTSEEIIAFARRDSNSLKDKTNFIRKIFNDEITVEKGVYY